MKFYKTPEPEEETSPSLTKIYFQKEPTPQKDEMFFITLSPRRKDKEEISENQIVLVEEIIQVIKSEEEIKEEIKELIDEAFESVEKEEKEDKYEFLNESSWSGVKRRIEKLSNKTFELEYDQFLTLFSQTLKDKKENDKYRKYFHDDKRLIEHFKILGKGNKKIVLDAGNVVIKLCPEIPVSKSFNTKQCMEELDKEVDFSKRFPKAFASTFRLKLVNKTKFPKLILKHGIDINIQEKLEDLKEDLLEGENIFEHDEDNFRDVDQTRNMIRDADEGDFSWGDTLPVNTYKGKTFIVAYDFD